MPPTTTSRRPLARTRHQTGASLAVTLITLVILSLVGVALVRSVDTSNLIAGNFAFRQAAVSANDVALEDAVELLHGTILACGAGSAFNPNAKYPSSCDPAAGTCQYYPSVRAEADGLPLASKPGATAAAIAWSALPTVDVAGGKYKAQFVIDRLCQTDDPGGDLILLCSTSDPPAGDSNTGPPLPIHACDREIEVFYRVTMRVTGPRETVSTTQTLVAAK